VAFALQVPNSFTDLDLTLIYISMSKTNIKFIRKKTSASARRLLPAAIMHAQALAAGLPRKDHV
jgi:hypothetical protein